MNGFPIGRILGLEIRVHLSWVFIVALVAVLAVAQIEQAAPTLDPALRWIVAGIIAAAFFVSVLAHELGHAIAARRRGLPTGPITVLFFGGSASLDTGARNATDEAVVAAAGPIVSLLAGGILVSVGAVLQTGADALLSGIGAVAFLVGVLNLILGTVNLVPAFPMDGGRLVRAYVWSRSRSQQQGSRASATAGRLVGWVLVGAGLAVVLLGNTMDGILLGLCGWFLSNASKAVYRRLAVEELLKDITVGEVMERDVPSISPQLTVDTFAERMFGDDGHMAMPVVRDDAILGVIGQAQLRKAGRKAWMKLRAEELMIRPPELPILDPAETVWAALDRLRETGLDGLPVVDTSGLLGILSRRTILRTIQTRARERGVTIR
jgi:Zn-dependent protease/predicted transcriptional regulator